MTHQEDLWERVRSWGVFIETEEGADEARREFYEPLDTLHKQVVEMREAAKDAKAVITEQLPRMQGYEAGRGRAALRALQSVLANVAATYPFSRSENAGPTENALTPDKGESE